MSFCYIWFSSSPDISKWFSTFSLSFQYEKLAYSTGKTSTCCKSAKKPPAPPFCLLVRYLARIVSHDINLPNHISCIIEHLIWDSGRRAIPLHGQTGKNSETGSINFMQFPATLVQLAEKPPFPSLSCLFMRDPAHVVTYVEYPCSPLLQIHTQIPPIQIPSLGYQLGQLFKILTYRKVQDTGSWCRWKACMQPYHNTH